MVREISNSDDVIDSRDVIARIEELEARIEELADMEAADDGASNGAPDADYDLGALWAKDREELEAERDEAKAELKALKALAEQASGYAADWQYGEALIRDSYFKEYAQELAEDIGAIDRNATWPNTCIDWDQAARELQMDYTSVEFDGVTYWIR